MININRDPKRIERILTLVKELWQDKPDLRFFQLIAAINNGLHNSNNPIAHEASIESENKVPKGSSTSTPTSTSTSASACKRVKNNLEGNFYTEDTDLETFLKEFLRKENCLKKTSKDKFPVL